MKLATNVTDYADGDLGMVELCASYAHDRTMQQWSKSEWIAYLNRSQLSIANKINSLYETYFLKSATTPTVDDQETYSLPTDLIHLMGIEVADSTTDGEPMELAEIHFTQRNFFTELQKANDKVSGDVFFVQGQNIRPMPNYADGSVIRTYYVKRLPDLASDDDESEIPSEHHELICLGAVRRARAKFDSPNAEIDRLYAEGLMDLEKSIAKFSPQRKETIRPFYGSFGPDSDAGFWMR